MSFWNRKRILVTGGAGFLGSFVVDQLKQRGVKENNIIIPRKKDKDLRIWGNCLEVTKDIDIVIHLAAKVGGIGFNRQNPATLYFDNIMLGTQVMEAARQQGVKKFVAIGTVCAYPKFTPVPFKESDLWNGYPEDTNAPYGLAKKMLLVQSQAYRQQYGFESIFLLPVNLYGPGDNFDLENSHVIPALIRKFTTAVMNNEREVEVWGTGKASREFLYVEDAAEGIVLATEKYDKGGPVNLGSGMEITIKELAEKIIKLSNSKSRIVYKKLPEDDPYRRKPDISLVKKKLNWQPKINLEKGLIQTIEYFNEYQ
ncbi:MAG: GDP-L-fucose synthase [Desulfobacteraceae bacterium]|nr:GDP-L-fucose synthase [Desulfobacteraceae bacterium]